MKTLEEEKSRAEKKLEKKQAEDELSEFERAKRDVKDEAAKGKGCISVKKPWELKINLGTDPTSVTIAKNLTNASPEDIRKFLISKKGWENTVTILAALYARNTAFKLANAQGLWHQSLLILYWEKSEHCLETRVDQESGIQCFLRVTLLPHIC
ncbi:unnamed protein product [Mytilus edulis]|uniref:Uncharacterized protein n=1 Tax=Mytilus edulis TaxID=6550 RepID=A0A8S3TWY8_MYTED|nr:unnamed protein product [Mytilus edulis]